MLRLRRYRVLLVCAIVITVLLYHVSKNSQWDHSKDVWREAHKKPNYDEGHEGDHPGVGRPQKPQKPQKQPPRPEQNEAPDVKLPQLKTSDGDEGGYGLPKKAPVPDKKLPSHHDGYEYQKQDEDAGLQVADPAGQQ
jgi:mannosyl-oligosaccharide alpha-1,2-mannosidase